MWARRGIGARHVGRKRRTDKHLYHYYIYGASFSLNE